MVLPDGALRWVDARGRALIGETARAVRLLGAAYDTTAAAASGGPRPRGSWSRCRRRSTPSTRDWRFTYVNAEAERLLGRAARGAARRRRSGTCSPAASARTSRRTTAGRWRPAQPVVFDAYYPAPLDAWYEVRAWPTPDGLSVYFLDVTARRHAQEQAAARPARRSLLAEVTAELTGTLDAEEAVARLARLVVPALADWCVVTLVDDDEHADWRRRLRDVGCLAPRPGARAAPSSATAARGWPRSTDDAYLVPGAADGRGAQVRRDATAAIRAALAPDSRPATCSRRSAPDRAVRPAAARRVAGPSGCSPCSTAPDRGAAPRGTCDRRARSPAGPAWRSTTPGCTASSAARRGAAARAAHRAPAPDHVQVVVRYQPAAEAAQVGGDWYDAFLQPDGATMLVIGDVIGHDIAAAAAMGQVRALLRGIAAHSGRRPGRGAAAASTASCRRSRSTPPPPPWWPGSSRRRRSATRGCTRLRWSNAGHPPPLLLTVDGTGRPARRPTPTCCSASTPTVARAESELTLERGATVLLYTDGLVERRGQSLDDGLARLRALLADARGSP